MRLIYLIRKGNPIIYCSIAVFLLSTFLIERSLLNNTNNIFTLPGDRFFINLSIAKNLAFSRVWGISKYEFYPIGTSLFFPPLLAIIFFIFGAHPLIAILINAIVAIIFIGALQQWLERLEFNKNLQVGIIISIILLAPLPILVLSGGESLLELLFSFWLITRLQQEWNNDRLSSKTYLYGMLVTAANFSTIYLIAFICVMMVMTKKSANAIKLLFLSTLPILIFGLLSLTKTGHFYVNLNIEMNWFNGIFLVTLIISIVVPIIIKKSNFNGRSYRIVVFVMIALLINAVQATQTITKLTKHLYKHDWLVGKFAGHYYNLFKIASQDLGVLSYFTDGRKLDLSKLPASNSPDSTEKLTKSKNIVIAIVNNNFEPRLPQTWNKIADWQTIDQKTGHGELISFYAVITVESQRLKDNLKEYQRHLDNGLSVTYYY